MKDVAKLLPTPQWNSADIKRLSAGTRKIVRRKWIIKLALTSALCVVSIGAIVTRPLSQPADAPRASAQKKTSEAAAQGLAMKTNLDLQTPPKLDLKSSKALGFGVQQTKTARAASANGSKSKPRSLADADAALARGELFEAEQILQAITGTEAPLAMFMLGKLYQDRVRDPARALAAFERVPQSSPLAEDALHRQISCLHALERTEEALLREQRYRARYPNGVLLKR